MAHYVNLLLDQGSSFRSEITVRETTGNGKDLSDYTITAQLRKSYEDPEYVDFTVDDTDSATGVLVLTLTSSQTRNLSAGRYVYDVMAESDTEKFRVIEGQITVNAGVTRG